MEDFISENGERNSHQAYPYRLIRNHYVVEIDGALYFIDTGGLTSFSEFGRIVLGDTRFAAISLDAHRLAPARELIGANVNGLIGVDVLKRTSLTIYKDGKIGFFADEASGLELPFAYSMDHPLGLNCKLEDGRQAVAIIDTGAMIYYGKYPEFFARDHCLGEKEDYNPQLNQMRSKFYEQQITIAGKTLKLAIGDNPEVSSMALSYPRAALVMNVTEFFEEVIVFDFARKHVIVR